MFDYRRYIEKLQYDKTAQITLGGIIVFMLIFPVYFAAVGSGDSSGDSMNVEGEWLVEFEFTNIASGDETIFVFDEGSEGIEFVIPQLEDESLYAIAFSWSYEETDEEGAWPDQCDDVTLSLDPSALSGYVSYSTGEYISTDCGDYVGFMNVILKDYHQYFELVDASMAGEGNNSFTTPANMTLGEVESLVAKNGFGRGPVTISVAVDTNTGSVPGPGPNPGPTSNNEDGEDVTISWRAISYTHTISNTADFVDET